MSYPGKKFEEGEGLAEIETELYAVQAAVNSLDAADIRDKAIWGPHLRDGVVPPSVQANFKRDRAGPHTYTEGVDDVTYTGYGDTGDRHPLGEPTVPATVESSQVNVSWDPDGDYPYLWVMANAVLTQLDRGEISALPTANTYALLCLQVLQGGTWRTVATSERVVSAYDREYDTFEFAPIDVPIRMLLVGAQLPLNQPITAIRLATSIINGGGSYEITWGYWQLAALPLRAGNG